MKHGISILTHSATAVHDKRLDRCLRSLSRSGYPGTTIIIDNGSVEERYIDVYNLERIVAVVQSDNLGADEGLNLGFVETVVHEFDAGFICHDDVVFAKEWWIPYLNAIDCTSIPFFSWNPPALKGVDIVNGYEIRKISKPSDKFFTVTPELIAEAGLIEEGETFEDWAEYIKQSGIVPYYTDVLGSHRCLKNGHYSKYSVRQYYEALQT